MDLLAENLCSGIGVGHAIDPVVERIARIDGNG